MKKLTPVQDEALQLLQAAGGALDYQADLYGFAAPGAPRSERVVMGTAKALIAAGLVIATRTKQLRGKGIPDQIRLTESAASLLVGDI